MGMIYPKNNSHIYVPVDLDGTPGAAIFRAAHHNPDGVIYWHLDENYLGSTQKMHQMALSPSEGWHTLTLVDTQGKSLMIRFEVLARK